MELSIWSLAPKTNVDVKTHWIGTPYSEDLYLILTLKSTSWKWYFGLIFMLLLHLFSLMAFTIGSDFKRANVKDHLDYTLGDIYSD